MIVFLFLFSEVFTESPVEFSVDLSSVPGDHAGKLKAIITAPSGDKMEAVVIDRPDGSSSCLFSLVEEGKVLYSLQLPLSCIYSDQFQAQK